MNVRDHLEHSTGQRLDWDQVRVRAGVKAPKAEMGRGPSRTTLVNVQQRGVSSSTALNKIQQSGEPPLAGESFSPQEELHEKGCYQSHTHNLQNRLRPSGPMLNLLLWFWLPRIPPPEDSAGTSGALPW